jgi:hypothetical protein
MSTVLSIAVVIVSYLSISRGTAQVAAAFLMPSHCGKGI